MSDEMLEDLGYPVKPKRVKVDFQLSRIDSSKTKLPLTLQSLRQYFREQPTGYLFPDGTKEFTNFK